jgi:hypothetical protein
MTKYENSCCFCWNLDERKELNVTSVTVTTPHFQALRVKKRTADSD